MIFSGSLTLSQGAATHLSGILKLNGDNYEAKFSLVFKPDKSLPKSRVPEPTAGLNPNRGKLVPMVDQNGGKFECL